MLWSMDTELSASTDWHAHEAREFICCSGGGGKLETLRTAVDLQPGRSILVAPGEAHRFVFNSGETVRLQFVCLDESNTAAYLSPMQNALLADLGRESPSVADHRNGHETLASLWQSLLQGSETDAPLRWSTFGLLLVLHGRARQAGNEVAARAKYRERIAEVCGWLDAHLEQIVSLEVLASRFGMSRSLLTREFKRHAGASVIDYCNRRRVERVAQLLASGSGSVTEAAFASGFANISHFHRQFKAVFGMTPAGFRRQVAGGRVDVV